MSVREIFDRLSNWAIRSESPTREYYVNEALLAIKQEVERVVGENLESGLSGLEYCRGFNDAKAEIRQALDKLFEEKP
jgi:hypothetical protein